MSDENSSMPGPEPTHRPEPTHSPGPAHEPGSAQGLDRRHIPQRSTRWATRAADALYATGLTPNGISVLSVIIALIGAVALALSGLAFPTTLTAMAIAADGEPGSAFAPAIEVPNGRWWLLLIAAVCIPLRLLCNMLDGMLAVERNMHSPTGDLFNELPDRIADVALLVGAGIGTIGIWNAGGIDWGVTLGWFAAVLAVLTAYVRTLGAANGVGNFFSGPMAKPPRMWVLMVASLLSIAEPALALPRGTILGIALAVIAIGSLVTIIVRLRAIARALRAQDADPARPVDSAGPAA